MRDKLANNRVLKFLFLALIFLATFSYAMFQGGFVSWFLFYSFLPFALYSLLLLFYPLNDVRLTRTISHSELTDGQELTVTIQVDRKSHFPLFYLVVEDVLPEQLVPYAHETSSRYQKRSLALLLPMFRKKLSFSYSITPIPRGEYDLKELKCKVGDMFGFVRHEKTFKHVESIYVLPTYQDIYWSPYNQQLSGTRPSPKKADMDYTTAVSVRDYVPGDKLSWIDWKATARGSKLLTKQFEQQISQDFMVFLDREKHHYGREESPLFEKAVKLAASVTNAALKQNAMIGLVSSGKDHSVLSINGGKAQRRRVFHHLARVQANGDTSFDTVVKKEAHHFPAGTGVLIISPSLEGAFTSTLKQLVAKKVQVEFFYVTEHLTLEDQAELNDLSQYGIKTHAIAGESFNEEIRGGRKRATR
ncbi:DUF58 domain-containing protein [Alkalihalobacillus macyae]|uniref:DUF58 domain-containing protein n=1 Tax=Guptibacillus hwajinpoensis TaxID=208199 RepID=UPI00273C5635|nr:DUF58 domain-containing protein [Alkalihalobacillus macyae]MDP4553559.1 DUF58 domain-containing protein [Alkalihalobacillus macyae]